MRKITAVGAAAALLVTTLSTPAWAAAPEAPTDVQVSWTDDGKVRVTWKDNGEANQVRAVYPDVGPLAAEPAAGAPNEVFLSPGAFPTLSKVGISVRSVGADNVTSEPARSPLFDTHPVPKLVINNAQSLSTTSVRVWWQRDTFVDETPNDPLDHPTGTWVKATVTGPAAGQQTEYVVRGVTTADVPVRRGPLTIKLSTGNEWGQPPAGEYQTVRVGTMSATSKLSPPARFSFTYWDSKLLATFPEIIRNEVFEVEVQARPNSSSPWKKVSRNGGQIDGKLFFTSAGAAGAQEYRLWVPAGWLYRDDVILVTPPVSTAAQFVRKYAEIGTGHAPDTARVGLTVHHKIIVAPALPLKAALQKWDGKQWRYVRAVQLDNKGKADVAIRAAGRGTTQKYRIATPAVKVNGLPVEFTTSDPFTLKVV
ncbi:hypothetical protein E1263_23710 [Kribbella antibiotica]|uniref:Fibronectin type III domain-containing protein n=1 Tax=Kribbella antibiotica TaxID=190195 RepID=A0A4R4ZIW0_9ACTN|nr:hypothetical protein [Kribbella antibiotica]TDD57459.1 hypothetical protein E1263_23710 [Kribbella antibiotica]